MRKPFPKGHDLADIVRQGGPSFIIKGVFDEELHCVKCRHLDLHLIPIFPPPTSVFSQKGFMAGRPEEVAANRKEVEGEFVVVHSFFVKVNGQNEALLLKRA